MARGLKIGLVIVVTFTIIIIIVLLVRDRRLKRQKLAIDSSQSVGQPLSSRKQHNNDVVNRWRTAAGMKSVSYTEQRDARYEIRIDDSLIATRNSIFPHHFVDIDIMVDMTQEPLYPAIMKEVQRLNVNVDNAHIKKLIQVKKFMSDSSIMSMATPPEVDQIYLLLLNIIANKVPGDVIELGVWKGGMGMFMKMIMDFYRSTDLSGIVNSTKRAIQDKVDRCLWLFDAFDIFPAPRPNTDGQLNAKDKEIHTLTTFLYNTPTTPEEIRDNFSRLGLMGEGSCDLKIVKGEFRSTVPAAMLGAISILRIDCDYYDSVMYCLDSLYDKVSAGGYVILDDYNNEVIGCNQAVHDFRTKRNITIPIVDSYGGSVYWQI